MPRRHGAVCIGIAAALLATAAVADTFHARLGRVPVDPRTAASVQGIGSAEAELDGNRLTIRGEFNGLVEAASEANLRLSQVVGVRGPVIHELSVTRDVEGQVTGSVRLSDDEIEALRAGRLYIQVHSLSAPDGNLWGWLLLDE